MDKLNDEIMVDRDEIMRLEFYSKSFHENGKFDKAI